MCLLLDSSVGNSATFVCFPGPEIDDLDGDGSASAAGTFPGIDDGLLDVNDNKPHILDVGDGELDDKSEPEMHDDGVGTADDGTIYPGPKYSRILHSQTIDVNTYQQKKNLAQGMMDLALLSANANQLRYVLESASSHPYYYPSLVFISLSIIFQIAVGVGLILNSRYDVNDKKEICKADKINNFTVLGIFLITIVNVFITSFSVASPTITVQPGGPTIQQAG
ncbi:Uncharacterized protein OBRU01_03148 [Operophtera brumata]|uniref:Ninjurin-1 n=1 Tax=Operophtera brumata TaxID=104452 RepID=A0A0L7LRD4_OPEBR|nr:Uncharacterized protein OBRU01_03148 [Operophtera brumata]